ncbi:hypothetical protein APHAL10511_004380 [Amanita phalloides]|nr:hypothetical protein APHAL10511_004380 [Amanita phalloides]
MPPEILIVGAGPSGLILALSLLRHGIPIRIIDNSPCPQLPQWNPTIAPRSLEVFKALGIIDDVLDQAILAPPLRVYNVPGQPESFYDIDLLPYVEPTARCPFLTVVVLNPARLKRILDAALARMGCSVEDATELVSFEQFYDFVNVKLVKNDKDQPPVYEDARFAWVVGADEAATAVCKLLGFRFVGKIKQGHDLVCGEVYVDGLSDKHWYAWGDSPAHHIGLRATGVAGLLTFSIAGHGLDPAQLCQDKLRIIQLLREGRSNLKFADVLWSSNTTSNGQVVDKFLDGRMMVAGVSAVVPLAHNIAIQDSFNLGWKLALVHKKVARYSLLNSYAEERLSALAGVIDQADALLSDSFRTMQSDYFKKNALFRTGVNYRWSSIVFDERRKDARERAVKDQRYYRDYDFDGNDADEEEVLDVNGLEADGSLRAGDRAPDAPHLVNLRDTRRTTATIKTWHLFQTFGPTYHTVLVFAAATRRWAHVLKSLASYPTGTVRSVLIVRRGEAVGASEVVSASFVLEDSGGYAHETYVADGRYGVVVVRPDWVIGAIAKGVDGMHWYLRGIFTRESL